MKLYRWFFKLKSAQKGFTLVEVLVAGVIITTLGAGIAGLHQMLSENQAFLFRNFFTIDSAQQATDDIIREIRAARVGENSAYLFEAMEDQEIVFYSDIDFDGVAEKVRYTLAGATLEKGIIEPTGSPATYPSGNEKIKTIVSNVRNGPAPIFFYYNQDWPTDTIHNPLSPASRLGEARLLRISFIINEEGSDAQADFAAESWVQIRMLKNNL